jgi:hypothetical protein
MPTTDPFVGPVHAFLMVRIADSLTRRVKAASSAVSGGTEIRTVQPLPVGPALVILMSVPLGKRKAGMAGPFQG